jgi:hypothetical protein
MSIYTIIHTTIALAVISPVIAVALLVGARR